jgi:putative phosphoesterase
MKILVVSDTHGAIVDEVVNPLKKEENINILVHCGDKYNDAESLRELLNVEKLYAVPGNCDFFIRNKPLMIFVEVEDKKLLISHGHMQHVKDGLDMLKKVAKENHVDAVLFGHTHVSMNRMDEGVLYFNPGSTILPKADKGSYGIIEINDGQINSKIVEI